MKAILLLLASTIFITCYDSFDSYYDNKEAVLKDGMIKKGWIPSIIPASCSNLHEWHSLDTNRGYGRFEFDLEDYGYMVNRPDLLEVKVERLYSRIDGHPDWGYDLSTHATPKELASEGFNLFKFEDFYIAVNKKGGHAFFWQNYVK